MIDAFYSDPHFGHKNILKYCPTRQVLGSTIEEHDEALIKRYNEVVCKDMTVCWVGDCFWYNVERSKKIMSRLNGIKILAVGNHDKSKATMTEIGFDLVADTLNIRLAEKSCLITHYPPIGAKHAGHEHDERFNDKRPVHKKGEFIIHGHTHMTTKVDECGVIHVGCDAWNYAPALLAEIENIIRDSSK